MVSFVSQWHTGAKSCVWLCVHSTIMAVWIFYIEPSVDWLMNLKVSFSDGLINLNSTEMVSIKKHTLAGSSNITHSLTKADYGDVRLVHCHENNHCP